MGYDVVDVDGQDLATRGATRDAERHRPQDDAAEPAPARRAIPGRRARIGGIDLGAGMRGAATRVDQGAAIGLETEGRHRIPLFSTLIRRRSVSSSENRTVEARTA